MGLWGWDYGTVGMGLWDCGDRLWDCDDTMRMCCGEGGCVTLEMDGVTMVISNV